MSAVAERVARAMQANGNDRLLAGAMLHRWARTLSGTDPELSAGLAATARRFVKRDLHSTPCANPHEAHRTKESRRKLNIRLGRSESR